MEQSQIIRDLYTASNVDGLQVQGSDVFVLHLNGTIVQMQLQDGLILKVFNTSIPGLLNYASQHTDVCDVDLDIIFFVSFYLGNAYTYNISSQNLEPRVENLAYPTSVTPGCVNGSVMYVVTELGANQVNVYNASWSLVSSFGSQGQLNYPRSAVISNQGHVVVADSLNYRVSMFTLDGQFVKHIITYDAPYYEGTDLPKGFSLRGKYLWITTYHGRLTRYIL